MGSLLESINEMFRFSFLLFILQATNIITNNDESLNYKGDIATAADNKTSRFYQEDLWQNVYIPRPLLLNERIRNPKFISKHPKRKKTSQEEKPMTFNKPRTVKNKMPVTSAPHANIL